MEELSPLGEGEVGDDGLETAHDRVVGADQTVDRKVAGEHASLASEYIDHLADQRPHLNGRTLGDVAREWGLPAPEAARRVLREGNAAVMNLLLYDPENTSYLATMPWMMTCTDGRDPGPDRPISHPRPFGAFTKKLKDYVIDEEVIPLPFAIRSFTGLAADFLGWSDRGYLREGYAADITVLDIDRVQDRATFEEPKLLAEGTVHVLVNGEFAMRDGAGTGELAGRPLVRGGGVYAGG